MTNPMAPFPATAVPADETLSWLLDKFVQKVTGVTGALLVSRDGLKMAVSGLGTDQADKAAAWVSSLHSLARSAGSISGSPSGGFRQAIIEDAGVLVFVTSADHAAARQTETRAESRLVGSVLGVLAQPGADPDTIGFEMGLLVKSVADHLLTSTRGSQ
ncbi:roadblock/LC7 domain-containing protein [Spirillospora sp. CA-142024]|uniref:roadblock/LC7 domain-containing protein n=1 Tax=Spirillospora sp. CA-142024 TaxID=3240036 RepID=UPI003D9315AC